MAGVLRRCCGGLQQGAWHPHRSLGWLDVLGLKNLHGGKAMTTERKDEIMEQLRGFRCSDVPRHMTVTQVEEMIFKAADTIAALKAKCTELQEQRGTLAATENGF